MKILKSIQSAIQTMIAIHSPSAVIAEPLCILKSIQTRPLPATKKIPRIQQSQKSAIQTMIAKYSSLLAVLLMSFPALQAQTDTTYHTINKLDSLLILIDTTSQPSLVDTIETCHEGINYGMYSLSNDSLFYVTSNVYGRDTLCSQVTYDNGIIDTTLYIITVFPSTSYDTFSMLQNASLTVTNDSLEIADVDSFGLCGPLLYGTAELSSASSFDYTSGYVSGIEEGCLVTYGDYGVRDTFYFTINVQGLAIPQLVTGEWYLDTDPGTGNGEPVSLNNTDSITLDLNIPLEDATNGLHTLFFRALDDNGMWSYPQSVIFFKQQGSGVNDVAQLEYFIDVDPGYGNGNFLPASNNEVIDVTFNVGIEDIPSGLHTLFIRAKNQLNYWSFAAAHTFFVVEGNGLTEIVELEYFIDTDPGYGNGVPVSTPVQDSVDLAFNVDLNELSTGIHGLYIRSKSDNGFWSHAQVHTFFVGQSADIQDITSLEYFFDIDPGYGNALPITITPSDSIDITAPISLSGLTEGDHMMYLRAMDESGVWSIIYQETVEVTESDNAFPEIAFLPNGLSIDAANCYDSVIDSFYIKNDGVSNLTFNISDDIGWLSYSQTVGNIVPDDSIAIIINANPQGLANTQNLVDIDIISNDANSPDTNYTIVFTVPQSIFTYQLSSVSIDFEEVQINASQTKTIDILNTSCEALQIDSIVLTSAVMTSNVSDTLVAEGESIEIWLTFSPTQLSAFVDSMFIYSDVGVDTIFIDALSVGVPVIAFDQDSLVQIYADCPESEMLDFKVYNNGDGPLYWEIDQQNLESWISFQPSLDSIAAGDSSEVVLIFTYPELAYGIHDYNIIFTSNDTINSILTLPLKIEVNGSAILSANVAVITPDSIPRNTSTTYTFNLQNSGCDNLNITDVTFDTPIFQSNVTSVYLPGYFDYPVEVTFAPPYAGTFIDTMRVTSDAGVVNIPVAAIGTGALTQEIQPLAVNRTIQACDGMTMDTIIVYNVGDGQGSWEITNTASIPSWLYIATLSDTLTAGDSTLVEIGFDATGLINNTYDTYIQFQFSDPITPSAFIPVSMYVEGAADISISQDTFDFGYTYFTTYKTDTLQIQNMGCDTFHIVGVDRPVQYMVSDSIFDILPNDSAQIVITYDPNEINLHDGELKIYAETDTLEIVLVAEGVDIPRITTLNKDSLVITMPKDIDLASLTDSTWVVWGDQTGRRFGAYSVQNGNEMVFEPSIKFWPNEKITNTIFGSNSNLSFDAYAIQSNIPAGKITQGVFSIIPTGQILNNANNQARILDIDNDGKLDIAFGVVGNSVGVSVFMQNSNSGFDPPISQSQSISGSSTLSQLVDYNLDGYIDLIFDENWQKYIYLNDGNGNFTNLISLPTGSSGNKSIISDIDLDNDFDLIYARNQLLGVYGAELYLTKNDGDDNFELFQTLGLGNNLSQFDFLDINSDGYLDLVGNGIKPSSSSTFKYLNYFENRSGKYYGLHSTQISTTKDLNDGAFGDYSGSGFYDLLVSDASSTNIILNSIESLPFENASQPFSSRTGEIIPGDIDGDGDQDFINFDNKIVFAKNTDLTFSESQLFYNDPQVYTQNLADLDNDGDLDFAFLDAEGRLWLAINEDSNAEMALSQDSINAIYTSCAIDTTYNIEIYNNGDSTLIWQVSLPPSGAQGAGNLPNWLQIDTTYGQVLGGDSLTFPVHINTTGLASGDYNYDLVWNTNDTTSYHDTLRIAFTLESDSTVTISEMALDYGLVDIVGIVSLDLMLHNFGCDTLDISGMFESGLVFTSGSLPALLYPFDSLELSIDLDAADLISYQDTLTINYEYGSFGIPLSAQGCYTSPVTEIFETVCDVDSVGVDSLFLMNVSGCDSLVIEYQILPDSFGITDIIAFYPFENIDVEVISGFDNAVQQGTAFSQDRNGKSNSSLSFDSYPDVVKLDHQALDALLDFSVSFWMRTSNASGGIISTLEPSTNLNEYLLLLSGGRVTTYIDNIPHGDGTALNNGLWHHIVTTRDGSTGQYKFYVDGNLSSSANLPSGVISIEDSGFYLGNDLDCPGGCFDSSQQFYGDIDDIMIFDRILNESEIDELNSYSYGDYDVTFVNLTSCDTAEVGIDTTTLVGANQYGCDSTVINITSLQTPISPDSLAAYYPFNGNANDMSGYGNDGVVNGATLAEDRFGNNDGAYSFDGVNDKITIENNSKLNDYIKTGELAIAYWVKPQSNALTNDLIAKRPSNNQGGYLVEAGFENQSHRHYIYTNSGWKYSDVLYDEGVWNFVVFMAKENDSLYVYKNGFFEAVEPLANNTFVESTSDLILMANSRTPVNHKSGELGSVTFYSRLLEAEEIETLFIEGPTKQTNTNTTCDPLEVGTDTTTLTNQYGCDSTVINITSLQTPIPPEGLVAYYPFDGNADDMSGYENDGVVNGATLTEDRFGNVDGAYSFDGVNQYIEAIDQIELTSYNQLSVGFWLKSTNTSHSNVGVIGRWNNFNGAPGSGKEEFVYTLGPNNLYFHLKGNNQVTLVDAVGNYNNGEWNHYVGTYDGATISLFRNGLLITDQAYSETIQVYDQTLEIGRYAGGQGGYLDGTIDGVFVYDTALTPTEIQQLYLQSKAPSTTLATQDTLLDFGFVDIGDTTYTSTYITNVTCDTIFLVFGSTVDQYTLASAPDTLLPYQSGEVIMSFTTDSIATYSDALIASAAGDTIQIALSAMAIGMAEIALSDSLATDTFYLCDAVSSKSFYIYNQGSDPLNFTISNLDSYNTVSLSAGSVAIGDSIEVTITTDFADNYSNGVYQDTITINSDDATDPQIYFVTSYVLDGLAEQSVNTTLLDFGTVIVGETQTLSFTIDNAGCDSISIVSITNQEIEFTYSNTSNTVLPYANAQVDVTYTPSAPMMIMDTILIITDYGQDTIALIAGGCTPSPTEYLITDVCDEVDVSTDTTFMTNQYGCDSLAITNSLLPTQVDDSQSEIVLLFDNNANDASTNGYNATLTGAVYGVDRLGESGNALFCDGFFDYATINTTGLEIGTDQFAISVWIKTASNALQGIVSKSEPGSTEALKLSIENGDITFTISDGATSQSISTSAGSWSDDVWHHILTVRDTAGLELIIDGISQATTSLPVLDFDPSTDIYLGMIYDGVSGTLDHSFDGSIDNFRLIKGNLPNSNISRLANEAEEHINTTELYEQVCDVDSVGIDTMFLTNGFGCDSLVVIYYELPPISSCPEISGYEKYGLFEGHCYYRSNSELNITSVDAFVNNLFINNPYTGNLLVIETEEENNWINTNLEEGSYYYFGLRDGNGIGSVIPCESETSNDPAIDCWVWDNGKSLQNSGYLNWGINDPNNVGNKDVALLSSPGSANGVGKWNTSSGTGEWPHILEITGVDSQYISNNTQSCDPLQIGTDTTLLTNQYGCDSTIIEITSLQTPISPEGLVAYYPFDGNAEDMSGYKNDGVVNGATLTTDRFGNVDGAYSFDGVDDYILVNHQNQLNNYVDNGEFSFSYWIKPENSFNGNIIYKRAFPEQKGFLVNIQNINFIRHFIYTDYGLQGIDYGLEEFEWQQIIFTGKIGGELNLYVNGENVSTSPLTGSMFVASNSPLYIMDKVNPAQSNVKGEVEDFMLFSKELTPSEIQQLYLQSKSLEATITSKETLIDFETVTIGDTAIYTTYITNATCDTVTVDQITTSQNIFFTDETSTTILPYQSNAIQVSFAPTAEVPYLADLTYIVSEVDTVVTTLKGSGCTLCACPTEDIVLHNQSEVDDYISEYGGCDSIEVNFSIDETGPITDISGLDFLKQVDGYATIKNTTTITDLTGLDNLQDITGSLTIQENSTLTTLDGLNRLKQTASFTITQNDALTTVNGIDSLTFVNGNLTVTNNINLTDCSPLCTLLDSPPSGSGQTNQGITGSVVIQNNPSECSTLNEVQIRCTEGCPTEDYILSSQAEVNAFAETFATCDSIIGNLTIDGDDITDLSGLSFIQVIAGSLTLKNNPALSSVSGLQNLAAVGNQLIIENNAITEINSLASLASVMGNMTIKNNASLLNVNGLTSLNFIDGNLIVTSNQSLTDCSGLCTLLDLPPSGQGQTNQGITGTITISGNPSECSSLTEVLIRCNEGSCPDFDITLRNQIEVDAYVATFSDCDSIFGSLTIQGGNSIQDITGLTFIQYVQGNLIFKNNYDLDSISGLDSIQYIGGDFKIENNHELQDISQLMMLTHVGGELRVYNNDMLPNLTGLDSITYIGTDVKVQHNAQLSDCSVLCTLLDLPPLGPGQTDLGIGGNFFINNNPAPCSNLDQVEAICTYGSLISQITIENLQDTIVEGDTLMFDIVVDYAPSDTLIVNLTSNNAIEVPLPIEVIILPDSIKTTVTVALPDDGVAEQNEVVTITAGAQYLTSDSDQFVLTNDDDIPGIALQITQDTISEAGGLYATTAKVVRLGTSSEVLNVILTSSSSEINLPTGVNILANESEKTFFIGVYDNAVVEGSREAVITASYIIPSCICPAPASSEGVKSESIIIADNDGPTLELSVNPLSMPEGKANAGTLTIKRNTDTSVALSVSLTVSDATEVSLPAIATIPTGQSQINIPITTLNDPLEDGNQEVTISANASGFTGGDVWVIVTDINKPDLIITEVTVEEDSIDSEVLFPFNVKINNKGLSSSTQGVNLIGYASKNNTIDASDHIIGTYFLDISVAAGDTIDYPGLGTSPESPGEYKLLFKVNPNQSITELLYLNNTSSPIDITIRPEYYGTVSVADSIFLIGEPVVLTGSSYNNQGVKRPNTPLELYIYQGLVRRNIQVTTNAAGNYSYTHNPLMSEYGHFTVGVGYPGLNETTIQDEYDVLGVKVNNGNFIIWNMDVGTTQNNSLSIRNVTEVTMSDVTLTPVNLPNGCQLVFDTIPSLAGNTLVNLGYTIIAGEVTQSGVYQEFPIDVYTGSTKLQRKTGYYVVNSLIGSIQTSIASINTTINQNTPKIREFTITNVGQGATGPISVTIPGNDWIRLVSNAQIPSLAKDKSATITVQFKPTSNLPLNTPATGNIAINATNANGKTVPFTVQKVSDQKGSVTVDVIDQFTYFTEEAPHVDSARVRISNYFTGQVFADGYTGADGTITFDSLPEGQLRIVVDAFKHKSYDGVIDISAGASFTEVVFLEYQAISFTWDVVPTLIDDDYDITLIMNFETNAPLPVVVISVPPELPDLEGDETFAFNIVLTNEGLITAQQVQLDIPDDPEYEFMTNYEPQDILAQQSIQVPVVMKLRSGNGARNSEEVIEEANRRLNIKN